MAKMNWSNVHYQNQFVKYRDQETINVYDKRFSAEDKKSKKEPIRKEIPFFQPCQLLMIIVVDETNLKTFENKSKQSLYKLMPSIKDRRFSTAEFLNKIESVLIKCGKKYYQVFRHISYPKFKVENGNYYVNSTTIEEIKVPHYLYDEYISVYKSTNYRGTVGIYMKGSYYSKYFGLKQPPLKKETKHTGKESIKTQIKEQPVIQKTILPVIAPEKNDVILIVYVDPAKLQKYEKSANNNLMSLNIFIRKSDFSTMPHRFKMLVLTDGDNFFSCGYAAETNIMVNQKRSHSFRIKIKGISRVIIDFEKFETVFPLTEATDKSCTITICKCK